MKKTMPNYLFFLFCLWGLLLIVSIAIVLSSKDEKICRYYDEKVEAATLTKNCQEAIYNYKIEHNIPIDKEDVYNSGMIGTRYSFITTTSGQIDAKRTSINPDFAAVVIDMFKEAGIHKGDQIGCVFSGSFPSLNLAVMCAIQVFKLDSVVMASVGASTYGANNLEFNFIDMVKYLNDLGLLTVKINYASLGGGNDTGESFNDDELTDEEMDDLKNDIINRIKSYDIEMIYISDFQKNIDHRMNLFSKHVPNMKLFINVGGNILSIGSDEEGFITKNGLVKPTLEYISSKKIIANKTGLIERYLCKNIPVAQFLNIKGLASKYNLPYNPKSFPEIGTSDVYYEISYNLTLPIISLVITIGFFVFIIYLKKKKNYDI